jgi:TRAP-type C4-dicarboxylate transport system permease small subunit
VTGDGTGAGAAGLPAAPLFRALDRLLGGIDRAASLAIMAAMAVLTVVVTVQVFLRYVLNMSLDWGWAVPRLCFVWVIFLSIPLGLRRGAHVGIDLLVVSLDERPRRLVYRGVLLLMAVLMAVVAFYALSLARQTWDQLMPTIPVSTAVFYVALIVCCVHSILHMARLFWIGAEPAPTAFDAP